MFKKLLFTALVLLFSGVSHGATVDSFHNFSVSASTSAFGDVTVSDSVSLSLDQFDPTLGTLNFISIDVSTFFSRFDGHASFNGSGGFLPITLQHQAEAEFSIGIPALLVPFTTQKVFGDSGSCISTSFCEVFLSDSGPVPTLNVNSHDPLILANVVGAGTFNVDYLLSMSKSTSFGIGSDVSEHNGTSGRVSTQFSGAAVITYDYDEIKPLPAVPIPAAFWLFGTALIGLVGFSKRRKAA